MKPKIHILAIHQPNYLPWLGYFYKIYASDVFVFLDDVQFSKKALTKRTMIRNERFEMEKTYLTIPIEKASSNTAIHQIAIKNTENWQQKHLRKLEYLYSDAPFFEACFPIFQEIMAFTATTNSLSDSNTFGIRRIAQWLQLETHFVNASELQIFDVKWTYNRQLIEYFDAKIYLSGTGAKSYNDESYFARSGRQLRYASLFPYLEKHPYPTLQGDFINGLSIVDVMMNVGAEGVLAIFHKFQENQKKRL